MTTRHDPHLVTLRVVFFRRFTGVKNRLLLRGCVVLSFPLRMLPCHVVSQAHGRVQVLVGGSKHTMRIMVKAAEIEHFVQLCDGDGSVLVCGCG